MVLEGKQDHRHGRLVGVITVIITRRTLTLGEDRLRGSKNTFTRLETSYAERLQAVAGVSG